MSSTKILTPDKMVMAAYLNDLKLVQDIVESGIHPDDYTESSMPAIISCLHRARMT